MLKSQRMIISYNKLSIILIDLSHIRENICFSGMEHCKLMQLTIFFLRIFSKVIINILDRILKTLSLLGGMCNLTKTIKLPLLSIIYSLYELIILIYELIIGKRFI